MRLALAASILHCKLATFFPQSLNGGSWPACGFTVPEWSALCDTLIVRVEPKKRCLQRAHGLDFDTSRQATDFCRRIPSPKALCIEEMLKAGSSQENIEFQIKRKLNQDLYLEQRNIIGCALKLVDWDTLIARATENVEKEKVA